MNYQFLLLFMVSRISLVFGGNVLVLCSMCSRSHKNVIEATAEGLANRNHSITIVSSFRTPIIRPNIKEIVVMDGFDYLPDQSLLEVRKLGILGLVALDPYANILAGCHATYRHPNFMNLLSVTFDLVIMDAIANGCLHGFAHKLRAPVIFSMALPSPAAFAMQLGTYFPPSFVLDPMLPFGQDMNLLQRTVNFVVPKLFWGHYFSWYGEYENIYRQYLGDDIPALPELESDVSMMLMNTHVSINHPRPTMPDVVEIGGVHCRPGRPLPEILENFISGSKDGIIVFSLGSIFKTGDLPEESRNAFLNAFSRVKQRVLWKWDHDEMQDLPPNVMLSKWLPLQDILAHPNTKLFMTHGGLLSTQEAIYHGVPMVGIPLFGDQDLNINRYVEARMAVFLEILSAQEKDILEAIGTVLNNPEFRNNVRRMSTLFRDRPQSAIKTAVFWSEYVMRHKGAPQLRSTARKLNFVQYHSLDVLAIIFGTLLASLGPFVVIAVKLYRKLLGKNCAVDREKLE